MGDISYRPIIQKMTWSYSRLESYHDCPYGWFLNYIQREPSEDRFYSSYGKFIHSVLERYYNREVDKDEAIQLFLTEFSESVSGERPSPDTVTRYICNGVEFLELLDNLPFTPVEIERKVDFDFYGVPFTGRIDYIGRDTDSYVIVDHKSRAMKLRSNRKKPTSNDKLIDQMLRQLYIYSEAARQEYGRFPKLLCFNCIGSKTLIKEEFDINAFYNTVDWVLETVKEIKNADGFPPRYNYFRCNNLCGVGYDCCYRSMF